MKSTSLEEERGKKWEWGIRGKINIDVVTGRLNVEPGRTRGDPRLIPERREEWRLIWVQVAVFPYSYCEGGGGGHATQTESERGWAWTTVLSKLGRKYHHDWMYARKWPSPVCVFSSVWSNQWWGKNLPDLLGVVNCVLCYTVLHSKTSNHGLS